MSNTSTLDREMTSEEEINPGARFAASRVPWLVGVGALVVYLLSLNYWMSFASTAQVAKASGWAWQPELQAPLNWLLTLPFRALPASVIPVGLNLLSAVLASVALMLLARTVALLPHDRTMSQRERQRDHLALLSTPWAWIPPVVAALVCGLQLSFWESATNPTTVGTFAVSTSMLDLALFAYVIRCLLEYRADQRNSWLVRSSFVYGLAITNDWAMIGFFPLFLTAMVWICGARFFNAQLLTRLFLAGLAGLTLYLLLPLVQAFSQHDLPFWYSLRYNLGTQRYMLLQFLAEKQKLLPLFLTAFVPIFWMGFRWPNSLGDTSARGTAFARFLFHFVHGFFLLACAWIALDPTASPRNQNLGLRFLTFYYLGAISIGYYLGYFLVVFGPHQPQRIARRLAFQGKLPNVVITAGALAMAAAVPLLLVFKNWPQIRQTNGPQLKRYAQLMAEGLPAGPALVISDDLHRTMLLEAVRATTGMGKDWVLVVSSALKDPPYHRYLKQRYGANWAYVLPKEDKPVDDPSILTLVSEIGQTRPVFYQQPSFGYFFENNYLEPHGVVYRVLPYPSTPEKELRAPALSEAALNENRAVWRSFAAENLPALAAAVDKRSTGSLLDLIDQLLHIKRQGNRDLAILGSFYSRAMTYWGVEVQRGGHFEEAGKLFQQALELNPDNMVAEINMASSRQLAEKGRVDSSDRTRAEDAFRAFYSFDQVVKAYGPFDDPFFCNAHAQKFYEGNNFRQAGQLFLRASELDPTFLGAQLSLGLVYVLGGQQDRALALLNQVRKQPEMQETLRRQRAEVMYLEVLSHLENTNYTQARAVVQNTLAANPGDSNVVWAATMVLMGKNLYKEALEVVNEQLPKLEIKNTTLLNKGWLAIQLGDFKQAKEALDELIAVEKQNSEILQRAHLNRAIALLQLKQEDAAAQDYAHLQKNYPSFLPASVYYGLGEIAYRKRDTNAAIYNYELYVKDVEAKGGVTEQELNVVEQRLDELRPGTK